MNLENGDVSTTSKSTEKDTISRNDEVVEACASSEDLEKAFKSAAAKEEELEKLSRIKNFSERYEALKSRVSQTHYYLLLMLAVILNDLIAQMKKISLKEPGVESCLNFFFTLYQLEGLSQYDTQLTIKGEPYPIEDFKLDARLVGLVPKSRVTFPGQEFQTRNLLECIAKPMWGAEGWYAYRGAKAMTPVEFATFQVKLANYFKTDANFTSLKEYVKFISVDAVESYALESKCHMEDMNNAYVLPTFCNEAIVRMCYQEDYFNMPNERVVKVVLQNTLAKYSVR